MRRAILGPVLLALALRLVAVLATDRVVADVERYQRVAGHLLDVSWNPYETKRLYPYPPPWAAAEAAAEWLARRGVGSFPVNVKLPVLAADLLLVALLAAAAGAGRASPLAPWLYAAHPVSLLVGGVHGQFDAIPLLFLLLATEALSRGRRDASALALAAAIASKSFPVLALPFLAFGTRESWRSAARYVALALAPGALLLLPFAVADFGALRRELFAYGGIADFGWTGVLRGAEWLVTGALPRSEARFWPVASFLSKGLFLAAWAGLVLAVRSGRAATRRAASDPRHATRLFLALRPAERPVPAVGGALRAAVGGEPATAALHAVAATTRGSWASISSSPPALFSPLPSRAGSPSWPGACGSAARPRPGRVLLLARHGGARGPGNRLAGRHGRERASIDLALALTQHLERGHEPRQLSGLEEMVGARRAAVPGLRRRVRLAQQNPARLERADERGEQRPMEVVEDEHELPLLLAEVRGAVLEIDHLGVER